MPASSALHRYAGPVVLDIGETTGAAIVYTDASLLGREIEVSSAGNAAHRTHTEVLERRFGGRTAHAAVFAALEAGQYSLWRDVLTDVSMEVRPGEVAEVDWRGIVDPDDFRLAQPEGRSSDELPSAARGMLPPRYRDDGPVCAISMGSAPMIRAEDGSVDWQSMWTTFCDLALAGGPKHRDTLLEPASQEAITAQPEAYARVVAEIERGLRLVTALPTATSTRPGWAGLQCESEAMARWLLRAIAAENVSVRREGATIYLPAAPDFRLEKEIKNVVTVAAKTFHYWSEHRDT